MEYQNSLALLQESRFLPFLQKFVGLDMVVVLEFANIFEGGRARVGSLELEVIEEFITRAIGLPTTREQWFKKLWLEKNDGICL